MLDQQNTWFINGQFMKHGHYENEKYTVEPVGHIRQLWFYGRSLGKLHVYMVSVYISMCIYIYEYRYMAGKLLSMIVSLSFIILFFGRKRG